MPLRPVRILALAFVIAACGGHRAPPPRDGRDEAIEALERRLDENRAQLPNDAATEAPVRRRSPVEFVRHYQRAGFFAGESAQRAADRIVRAHRREWGEAPPLATRLDELTLLAYDRDRAWFEDLERDVLEGNDAYVEALGEWSRISKGAFEPRDVREQWHGEEGPVTIRFELDGSRRTVEAAPQGDFLDLCVLTAGINPLIEGSGRQFAVYRPDAALGQVAFVVALTAGERSALERRGWVFAAPDEVRHTFGYGQAFEAGEPSACG